MKSKTRDEFRAAYRAVRLIPHKWAGTAAIKKVGPTEMLDAALRCWTAPVWRGGAACAREAAANGLSFKKAIALHLQSVRHRRRTGYLPATKFPLPSAA